MEIKYVSAAVVWELEMRRS